MDVCTHSSYYTYTVTVTILASDERPIWTTKCRDFFFIWLHVSAIFCYFRLHLAAPVPHAYSVLTNSTGIPVGGLLCPITRRRVVRVTGAMLCESLQVGQYVLVCTYAVSQLSRHGALRADRRLLNY